jgi:DNA primase
MPVVTQGSRKLTLVEKLRHFGPAYMRASGLFNEQKTQVDGLLVFHDRFRDRLMFPIENEQGETIAFGGRMSPNDRGPKYINSPETELYKKGEELFNFERARSKINKTGRAVIVEGYLDATAAHQAGVQDVVALSGTELSTAQASSLAENARTVILNLDADAAGDVARERNIPTLLQAGLHVQSVLTPHDPAHWLESHTRAEYREEIRGARPLMEVLIDQAGKKFDVSGAYGKSDEMKWIIGTLENVPPSQRAALMAEVEEYSGTPKQAPEKVAERAQHRAAWDMTITPSKSVSITALTQRSRMSL